MTVVFQSSELRGCVVCGHPEMRHVSHFIRFSAHIVQWRGWMGSGCHIVCRTRVNQSHCQSKLIVWRRVAMMMAGIHVCWIFPRDRRDASKIEYFSLNIHVCFDLVFA